MSAPTLFRTAAFTLATALLVSACAPPPQQQQTNAPQATAIDQSWPRADEPMVRVEVTKLQRHLTALGYSTRGFDGVVGVSTREAIRDYQTDKKVRADGVVSRRLTTSLQEDATRLGVTIDEPRTTTPRRTVRRPTPTRTQTTRRTTTTQPTAPTRTETVVTPTPTPTPTPAVTPEPTPVNTPAPVIRRNDPFDDDNDSDSGDGGGWG